MAYGFFLFPLSVFVLQLCCTCCCSDVWPCAASSSIQWLLYGWLLWKAETFLSLSLSLCIRAKAFSVQPDSLGWMLRTKHVNVFSEELEEIHFSEGEYKHLFFTFLNVNLWKKCVFYVKENTNTSKTSWDIRTHVAPCSCQNTFVHKNTSSLC